MRLLLLKYPPMAAVAMPPLAAKKFWEWCDGSKPSAAVTEDVTGELGGIMNS